MKSNNQNTTNEDLLYRKQYAQQMISYMNQSVDPCDNFYEYACGNYKNKTNEKLTGLPSSIVSEIKYKLIDMVEELLKNPDESTKLKYTNELQKANRFYETCLQANLYPLQKSGEYLKVLENITGFPAIDGNWQANNFDWFNATAHLSVYRVNSFVKESTYSPVSLELPDIGLDLNVDTGNIKDKTTRVYTLNEQRMRQYLTTYGVVEPKVTEVVNSIFELWHAILNITAEFQQDEKKCVELGRTKYNVKEWKKWENYFSIVWNGLHFGEIFIKCPCPYFYMKIDEIFLERKEMVANYLAIKFLYHMDAHVEDNDAKKMFCKQKVMNSFKFLIDQLYMMNRDFENTKREASVITEHIRAVFRENLRELHSLDTKTREEVLAQESAISFHIGRTEATKIIDDLIGKIKELPIKNSNYEKNNLEVVKFQAYIDRYLSLLSEFDLEETVPENFLRGMQVEAWNDISENSVHVMAGILNPPVYHKSLPWVLKYATLGSIIGHELTHGIDEIYESSTKCYIDKFNEYKIPEIRRKINGDKTKNENIADYGGLLYALKAYKRHIAELNTESKEFAESERMPGLDITKEQLFYLGFSQLWCADYTEEDFWRYYEDGHAYGKYRALGTLSSINEFAEAYNCAVGSKMNPKKKCFS